MKKSTLLQSDTSYLISKLGHTDEFTICDAGLPIPNNVQRIDLALTHNVPSFIQTVNVILSECKIEGVILAEEFKQISAEHHLALISILENEQKKTGTAIDVIYITHEEFKTRTQQSKAIIRTGECTPYANVIFQSSVTF